MVKGDIKAEEILVAGTVYGNLTAGQRIELTESGRVLGDMITKTLVIDEGASFKGNCTMEVVEERKASEDRDLPEQEPEASEVSKKEGKEEK